MVVHRLRQRNGDNNITPFRSDPVSSCLFPTRQRRGWRLNCLVPCLDCEACFSGLNGSAVLDERPRSCFCVERLVGRHRKPWRLLMCLVQKAVAVLSYRIPRGILQRYRLEAYAGTADRFGRLGTTPAVPKKFGRAYSMPEERSPFAGSGHEVQDARTAHLSSVITRRYRLNWIRFCDPVLCKLVTGSEQASIFPRDSERAAISMIDELK